MDVDPPPCRDGQRLRREDLIEARHHDDIWPVRSKGAHKGLRVGVGGDLDRTAQVPGNAGHQVGLWMGALPAGAADGGPQGHPPLDQVEQERRPIVGGDAAEHDAKALLIEAGTGIGTGGHGLEVDRHHRELGLRPNAGRELIEPWIVEGRTPVERRLTHAIARRTTGGRWSSSPYAQPSRSITWTSGISWPARCRPIEICKMQPGLAEAITCAPDSTMFLSFQASASFEISGWGRL